MNKVPTIREVFDTFTEEQKGIVYDLVGQALDGEKVIVDWRYFEPSLTEEQLVVVNALITMASTTILEDAEEANRLMNIAFGIRFTG